LPDIATLSNNEEFFPLDLFFHDDLSLERSLLSSKSDPASDDDDPSGFLISRFYLSGFIRFLEFFGA
jgi:hypothetical protein